MTANESNVEALTRKLAELEHRVGEVEAGHEQEADRLRNLAREVRIQREDHERLALEGARAYRGDARRAASPLPDPFRPPRIRAPRIAIPGRSR